MKVYIATPSTGGTVTNAYATTLIATTLALSRAKASWCYQNIDSAEIVIARNLLANSFLRDQSSTHLLFIDSDMAVDLEPAKRMLGAGCDFVGAVYPERQLDADAYAKALAAGEPQDIARAKAMSYNVQLQKGALRVTDNLLPVLSLGFGYVLIAREVFVRLIDGGYVRSMRSARMARYGLDGETYDFFGVIPQKGETPLSEDYSFCQRVRQLGDVTLWGWAGSGVHHVGSQLFGAPFLHRLQANIVATKPKPDGG